MFRLDTTNFDEVEVILKELVSGEIKDAYIMIDGVVITSSGIDSGIDSAETAQLVVVGRTAEEALSIRGDNFERMVITANSEVTGGFDIIIQRTGEDFIIVKSKGILPGSPLQHKDGNIGGTLCRIDTAADKIAKIFLNA